MSKILKKEINPAKIEVNSTFTLKVKNILKKTSYNIPYFEDPNLADLNEYSVELAEALKALLDKFGAPLTYKGSVESKEDLPQNANNGEIYAVTSEDKLYIYDGTDWIVYSKGYDLSKYATKNYVDEQIGKIDAITTDEIDSICM